MNTHKVKRHRNSDIKTTENHNKTTAFERSVMNNRGWGLKLVLPAQPRPQFLKWYKTFTCSWFFGSHDNLLTRL